MVHVTTQIRNAAKSLLSGMAGINTTASARLREWGDSDLPCASVWTPIENLTLFDKGFDGQSATIKRNIDLIVEVLFEISNEDLADDEADAWKVKIEEQLASTLGGLVNYLMPVSATIDFATSDDDGAYWFGRVTYQFEAHTFTAEGLPEATT